MYREQATFYRAALLLGLIRGETVVKWSDAVLARDPDAPASFVEVAATPPGDLSALRHALYPLCDDRESESVVNAILALAYRDLHSGRRPFDDTVRVLSQVRRFLKLDPGTDDTLKSLLVAVWQGRHHLGADAASAETRLRDWLIERERLAIRSGLVRSD